MIKRKNTVTPVAQEPHGAENCRINESPHNYPDTDCGHYVEGPGPGTYSEHAPGGPGHQDCDHD